MKRHVEREPKYSKTYLICILHSCLRRRLNMLFSNQLICNFERRSNRISKHTIRTRHRGKTNPRHVCIQEQVRLIIEYLPNNYRFGYEVARLPWCTIVNSQTSNNFISKLLEFFVLFLKNNTVKWPRRSQEQEKEFLK